MKHYRLRWIVFGLAALCALFSSPTYASQTVTIGPGDSLDSLARKYHVSKKAIAHANGIGLDAVLRDGRKLAIPDPPSGVVRPATMHKSGKVLGDRITVRLGPTEKHHRVTLLDNGAAVSVTGQAGHWYQVQLPSGASGWIRSDHLKLGGDIAQGRKAAKSISTHVPAAAPTSTASSAAIGSDGVTVRRGPDTKQPRIALLDKGAKVAIVEKTSNWSRIKFGGKSGWVRSDFLSLHAVSSAPVPSKGSDDSLPAVVLGDHVTVRRGPDIKQPKVTLLDNGTPVAIQKKQGAWYEVRFGGGESGWIRSNHVRSGTRVARHGKVKVRRPSVAKRPSVGRLAAVSGDSVTVRVAPDTSRKRIALLEAGHPVLVMGERGDWYHIKLGSGREGWIRSELLAAARRQRAAVARTKTHSKHETRVARRSEGKSKRNRQEARRYRTRSERVASGGGKRSSSHRVASGGRRRGRAEASMPETDDDVVRTAYNYRGVPYHFGGTTRDGFDCSGFTSYVYKTKGVKLPHSAAEQFGHGKRVKSSEMKEGDLVFFHTTRKDIGHVGIYAGNNKFVHASSGGGRVRVDSLEGYYKNRFRGARRVK